MSSFIEKNQLALTVKLKSEWCYRCCMKYELSSLKDLSVLHKRLIITCLKDWLHYILKYNGRGSNKTFGGLRKALKSNKPMLKVW